METAKNVEDIGKMSHEVLNDRALTT
jgi:Ras-related protein Rab-2A